VRDEQIQEIEVESHVDRDTTELKGVKETDI
jgi:hypothetical protein